MMSLKRLLCYVIQMLLLLFNVQSQTVTFAKVEKPSPYICDEGLVAEEEKYTLIGRADPSTAANPKDWDSIDIAMQIRKYDMDNFVDIPRGRLLISQGCNGYKPLLMYCLNSSSGVYYFAFNMTAAVVYSGATIRAAWTSKSGDVHFSGELKVPVINSRDEHLTYVTVGGVFLNFLRSSLCFIDMNDTTPVTFCVADKPQAAYFDLRIYYNGSVVNWSTTNCLTASSWNGVGHATMIFEFHKTKGCTQHMLYKCRVSIRRSAPRANPRTRRTVQSVTISSYVTGRVTANSTPTDVTNATINENPKTLHYTLWPVLLLIVFSILALIDALLKMKLASSVRPVRVKKRPQSSHMSTSGI